MMLHYLCANTQGFHRQCAVRRASKAEGRSPSRQCNWGCRSEPVARRHSSPTGRRGPKRRKGLQGPTVAVVGGYTVTEVSAAVTSITGWSVVRL
jgi:hypothetical protein